MDDKSKRQPAPHYSGFERLQHQEARRKVQRRRRIILTSVGLALTLSAGVGVGYALGRGSQADTTVAWTSDEITSFLETAKALSETGPIPTDSASELWSNDRSRIGTPLLGIDLEAETQWAIYGLCNYDNSLFCAVMAIANVESGFQADLTGDDGTSIGMMQVSTKWHTSRMEALGVTDLTDPVQCAAVAIDYIKELEALFEVGPESHILYMAYNMGASGCRRVIQSGTYSSSYSREVMATYVAYMTELGGLL